MPNIFKPLDIHNLDNDVKKDYFDRHTPVIICEDKAKEGEKFKVKIRVGSEYAHADEGDHYIGFIQLWNRETLLVETRIFPGTMANKPAQPEVDFFVVPKVGMNLTALSYCTKHGLWQSISKEINIVHGNKT